MILQCWYCWNHKDERSMGERSCRHTLDRAGARGKCRGWNHRPVQHETEQAVHAASARPSKSRSTIQTEETNHPHSAEVRPLDLILEGSPSHQGLKIMKGNENNNRTKCNFRPFQASMPKIHLNHCIPPLPLLSIIFSSRRRGRCGLSSMKINAHQIAAFLQVPKRTTDLAGKEGVVVKSNLLHAVAGDWVGGQCDHSARNILLTLIWTFHCQPNSVWPLANHTHLQGV